MTSTPTPSATGRLDGYSELPVGYTHRGRAEAHNSISYHTDNSKLHTALRKALTMTNLKSSRSRSLGVFIKFKEQGFGWASRLVHYMLGFKLDIKKKYEMWSRWSRTFEVQILNSPPVEWSDSDIVAVGHKLYAINKEDDVSSSSSNVFFLDCRTHTWVETPSLRFAHTNPGIDGMMYLAGSYENPDSLNCVQVLDTKNQTWKAVPEDKRIFRDTDFEGKVYKNLDGASGKRSSLVLKLKDSTIDL
ncbi:hypothetical protein Bca52824_042085 [Brassica carinata]|uniref:FKB95-like N-terminal Kelch domain-containing protein n=1 Tax=Brassica carinata TaxID=52824 RepID=A0A8X7V0K6_BRACI|nr:hypothetical protein Bca52824_042085 [Brassica carinata]